MPDFAPTATPRVIWLYVAAGIEHRIQVRRPRDEGTSASLTAARLTFLSLFTHMNTQLADDTAWLDEFYIPQDSNVEGATGYGGPSSLAGDVAAADFSPMGKVTATTFVGKGTLSRTSMHLYGVFWDPYDPADPSANGRVTVGENASIASIVGDLNSSTPTYAIDSSIARFRNYADVKVNDALLADVRRGILG